MAQIRDMFKKLLLEWEQQPKNVKEIEKLVEKLKEEFIVQSFIPLKDEQLTTVDILTMQRKTVELSACLMCVKHDMVGFQREIAQLKHYYGDVSKFNGSLKDSEMKNQMLGLNLMYLLSQNKLPEFHMELERISAKDAIENPYISVPVKLEQYLMEGTYNKIFITKANVPSPYYSYFVEILLETVRGEIANCIEKAYAHLNTKETSRLLFFDGPTAEKDALKFAEKRGWRVGKDGFDFIDVKETQEDEPEIDAVTLSCQQIYYAKQLEMIV